MDDIILEKLNTLDREALIREMSSELSIISGKIDLTPVGLARRTGLDEDRILKIAQGKRKMKWSEYMSILFFLYNDEKGRGIVEDLELFPEELKMAMKINRNEHP